MTDLVERLREACSGHPHAKIAWPHRILHEAADALEAAQAQVAEVRRETVEDAYRRGVEDACRFIEPAADMADNELTQYGKDKRAVVAYARIELLKPASVAIRALTDAAKEDRT